MDRLTSASEYLQPEMLLDVNNPSNDPFYKTLDNLRALAVLAASKLRPKQVKVARLVAVDVEPKLQAKQLRCAVATIYHARRQPQVQELVTILRHMARHAEGPNLSVRKNMLWRIAVRAEASEPNIAIQALKELNKIDGAYPLPAIPAPTQVNVTINHKELPRTRLDG